MFLHSFSTDTTASYTEFLESSVNLQKGFVGPGYFALSSAFCNCRIGQWRRGLAFTLQMCRERINPEISVQHLFETKKHGRHLHLLVCDVWVREWLETEGFYSADTSNKRFNKRLRRLMNNNERSLDQKAEHSGWASSEGTSTHLGLTQPFPTN